MIPYEVFLVANVNVSISHCSCDLCIYYNNVINVYNIQQSLTFQKQAKTKKEKLSNKIKSNIQVKYMDQIDQGFNPLLF